ncbi:hypothetical protein FGIG_01132, partial [Fasciola gigantica]
SLNPTPNHTHSTLDRGNRQYTNDQDFVGTAIKTDDPNSPVEVTRDTHREDSGETFLQETRSTIDLTASQLGVPSDKIPLRRDISRKAKTNLFVSNPSSFPRGGGAEGREQSIPTLIRKLIALLEAKDRWREGTGKSILQKHAEDFTLNEAQLRQTSLLKHRADTGNASPTKIPPRRTLLETGGRSKVIQPSNSPWSPPPSSGKKGR